jgi:hypothetical protein
MTTQSLAAFAGGLGGLLPDVLWGLADNSDLFILKVYSRFHHAMHTRIKGASAIYTLTWQIAAAACALTILHA